VIFTGTVYVIDKYRPGNRNGRVVGGRELPRKISHKWVMATWMAEVRSTARRLEAELHRTDYDRMNSGQQADYVAICHAIDTAKRCAEWSPPRPAGQHLAGLRQLWRRAVSWWTRLIDRQAKDMLSSAGSRSDRGVTPPAPDFDGKLTFVTVADDQAH
jgi:hypothetical protein